MSVDCDPVVPATLLAVRIPDFEAAIRKAADPGLARRPVVIVSAFKPLGRVLAACALAYGRGIRAEMHYPDARGRCPQAAFLLPDAVFADACLDKLVKAAGAFSPLVEPVGGGRVLLDTRGTEKLWGDASRVAALLGECIRDQMHLPSATGLAARRPWSILASRAAKPEGLYHVAPGSEDAFLDRVPLGWVDGLTTRTRDCLVELNMRTVGELRQFSREELLRRFGVCGDVLWETLHPRAWDAVGHADGAKREEAVRVEAVLAEATVVRERLLFVVRSLAGDIAASLRGRGLGAGRLELTLLHADGVVKSAGSRTGGFIQAEEVLAEVGAALFCRVFLRRVRVVRLWLAAERLSAPERQGSLFPDAAVAAASGKRDEKLVLAMDGIRKRFGGGAVCTALTLPGA